MTENPAPVDMPWMVVGDLNEVVSQSKKMRGRKVTNSQGKNLKSWMEIILWDHLKIRFATISGPRI